MPNVLYVCNSTDDVQRVREILAGAPNIHVAHDADDCGGPRREKTDVVLLDMVESADVDRSKIVRVRAIAPEAAIVVLTNRDDEAFRAEARQAGVRCCLIKSRLSGDILARAIDDVIEREQAELAFANIERRCYELTEANAALQQEIDRHRRLEKEILEIAEAEQRRIGQELHDGLGQQLTSVAFLTKLLEQKLQARSLAEATQAKRVVGLVNEAISYTRSVAKGLHPVELDVSGLMSALQQLAANTTNVFGIACEFGFEVPVLFDDHTATIHLYRIVQEAVNNAIKHAQPQHIAIKLTFREPYAIITVSDDGRGIDPRTSGATSGMGLHIMSSRAAAIGAALEIRRGESGGTVVTVMHKGGSRGRSKI